ncbi:MAG: hypothetical protein K0R22_3293, partial [Sporomusa sp.]|nr:hypothetical protein [Sporomusa sp.]
MPIIKPMLAKPGLLPADQDQCS